MATNVKLMKRFKRPNVTGRRAYYFPRAVSMQKKLEPGTPVECVTDAEGEVNRLVTVCRVSDLEQVRYHKNFSPEKFVVFLEDLAE